MCRQLSILTSGAEMNVCSEACVTNISASDTELCILKMALLFPASIDYWAAAASARTSDCVCVCVRERERGGDYRGVMSYFMAELIAR